MDKKSKFYQNEYFLIILIIILAYILRILPYLFGYHLPLTEDSMIEYQQILYLIKNNAINVNNQYALFPVLHILIYGLYSIGFNSYHTFMLLPPLIASCGLIFFYLFLRKYFDKKGSLISCLVIATFGFHIHWSSQSVRETLGLFFFPLLIYLFDNFIKKKSISSLFILLISYLIFIATHAWSNLMYLIFIFLWIVYQKMNKSDLILSILLYTVFLSTTILYWLFFYTNIFVVYHIKNIFITIPVGILSILFIIFLKLIYPKKLNNRYFLLILSLFLIIGAILSSFITSFRYPIHQLIILIILFILGLLGYKYQKNENSTKFFKIVLSSSIILILFLAFMYLTFKFTGKSQFIVDPLRMIEFIIYPYSIFISYGILNILKRYKFNKKTFYVILTVSLIISGILFYPSIFIFHSKFENTPIYDIRNDVRYISPETINLIDYANKNGYEVISIRYIVNTYQKTFYKDKENIAALFTSEDKNILKYYNLVNDEAKGVINPKDPYEYIKNLPILYKNNDGKLYILDINKDSLKKFYKRYNAK